MGKEENLHVQQAHGRKQFASAALGSLKIQGDSSLTNVSDAIGSLSIHGSNGRANYYGETAGSEVNPLRPKPSPFPFLVVAHPTIPQYLQELLPSVSLPSFHREQIANPFFFKPDDELWRPRDPRYLAGPSD